MGVASQYYLSRHATSDTPRQAFCSFEPWQLHWRFMTNVPLLHRYAGPGCWILTSHEVTRGLVACGGLQPAREDKRRFPRKTAACNMGKTWRVCCAAVL